MIKLGAITTSSKEDKDDAALPLSAFLRTGPLTSRHKVVLIDEADRMNAASANALLKTLEEPPPYGMIILTTREVGRVLPTILSRCVAVACEAPVSESGWSDMTDPTYGTDLRMDENAELFGSLRVFAHQLLDRPWTEAMVASEEFRGICAEIEKKEGISARHAYGEGLALLGRLLLRAGRLEAAQRAVEAHRRILGNGNASLTCDAFFADIMNPSS
jgi:DNA polymerase-3 subunit delta'